MSFQANYLTLGTMCRKWTASLIAQFLVVPPAQLVPPLESQESYTEFESSPRRFRGFCSKCGSSLIWRSDDDKQTLDLFLGTLDEKWLVKKASSQKDGRVAQALARPSGTQFWMENAISGVTDTVAGGKRYPQEGPESRTLEP